MDERDYIGDDGPSSYPNGYPPSDVPAVPYPEGYVSDTGDRKTYDPEYEEETLLSDVPYDEVDDDYRYTHRAFGPFSYQHDHSVRTIGFDIRRVISTEVTVYLPVFELHGSFGAGLTRVFGRIPLPFLRVELNTFVGYLPLRLF
jgi:hypothetical protein